MKRQEEVSVNAEGVNDTDAIVQFGSQDAVVADIIEMNDGRKGVLEEIVDDGAQAGGSEENIADEVDECSQFTDDGMREGEQWLGGEADSDLYTVEEINAFLDETKGKSGVEVDDYFPDVEKLSSVMKVRKTSSYQEISQQKRFRLKKHLTTIRKIGRERLTRGTTKLL